MGRAIQRRKALSNIREKIDSSKTNEFIESVNGKGCKKKRKCLMCKNLFLSEGPWNHRCPKCENIVNRRFSDFYERGIYKFSSFREGGGE